MNNENRQKISGMLIESYKHREAPETKCAICGMEKSRYAFHVIQLAQGLPNSPRGHVDGSYPICEKCAPPCKKCGLPIQTNLVIKFYKQLKEQQNSSVYVSWGVGVCDEHIHILGMTF